MMHNFNAGPSILPAQVIEKAKQAIVNFNDSGLSLLEIGHRTEAFESVMDNARSLVKELMHLNDDMEVLFLHGGATTQFMQVPLNLLASNATALYTDTGVWANKAIKEAKDYGNVQVVCSSAASNYNYIPKDFVLDNNAAYVHITTNNTIYGTQWQNMDVFYKSNLPIVADMSSDIFSRVLDFNKFGIIYAGAQKNMGAAGVNLVVINKNLLGKVDRKIPTILNYKNHIDNGSMLNTPPVFAIYVAMLTLQWIKDNGGVAAMEANNNAKANLLYSTIDALPMFKPTVAAEDRSKMNACFVMENEALEKELMAKVTAANIYGIKGHRSVGGCRASMYNALPLQSVEHLCAVMKEFAS
jgi:phosphoserine aminotransferase